MDIIDYYTIVEKELFEKHSLSAFVVLMNGGREIDFEYKDIRYSITQYKKNDLYKIKLGSIDVKNVHIYESIEDFVIDGKLEQSDFLEAWKDIKLGYLY